MGTTVTVWNEFVHEREDDDATAVYPDGIHRTIADALDERGFDTRTATLDEPEHGLTEDVLDETDVLVWWGHTAHETVDDSVVERVADRVLGGMGLLVLHSASLSKVFRSLLGTTGTLRWREADERERLWVTDPGHEIAAGVEDFIELAEAEMYGEPFDVPTPDSVVFTSWFEGGEVFRSGCCWRRGKGRVFFFRPGHETHPIYHDPTIQRVLANAAEWATPAVEDRSTPTLRNVDPCERIEGYSSSSESE
ncbi:ThuA domain-containing protein [Halococcus hamelinensis]|uniref:Trehalose utilization protein n=1 Tax=Halococcus hamelinensis 100A6 TaxID=1132509 RepID=M0LUR5_9EURY|nr:trehalose utilization protein ThuA [Halococcus hamelinensis]EMA37312.1 trehalose utilization protein [Halococcus hamelinensis 100A6]